ncbi:hypothetical protein MMC29_003029 [Sticta canariensis]|nr:hypothetical protein [Sticta canariensis]
MAAVKVSRRELIVTRNAGERASGGGEAGGNKANGAGEDKMPTSGNRGANGAEVDEDGATAGAGAGAGADGDAGEPDTARVPHWERRLESESRGRRTTT